MTVVGVRVYFEGDVNLRRGFRAFLASPIMAARSRGLQFKLIATGGNSLRDFAVGVKTNPEFCNILLVDAEAPVGGQVADNLARLAHRGVVVGEAHVHLMVEVMESWFLADRPALQQYYGTARLDSLPGGERVEDIPKGDVLAGLKQAARTTTKGEYHKTRHAPDLLSMIDASRVTMAAPHARRLLDFVSKVCASGHCC